MFALDVPRGLLGFVCWMRASRPLENRSQPGGPPAREGSEGREHGQAPIEEEFHRLFERYFRPVYYFFLRRGIPEEDCHDLAQETFLRVYRGIGQFRRDASVQTWLFQIATNLWRNHVRYHKAGKREVKEVSLEGAMERGLPVRADRSLTRESESTGPLAGILANEKVRILREALQRLPPQMRSCVMLRIDQDLKYREIAHVMRISIDTVKSQISQARGRLERDLGEYFDLSSLGGNGG